MATKLVAHYMNDTTPVTTIETGEDQKSSSDRENILPCEQDLGMLFLFGGSLSTPALTNGQNCGKRESIAPRSATKERTRAADLFAKRTRLLISAGLVRGITPTSIRNTCGVAIPDFVSSWQDGNGADLQKVDC